MVLGLILLLQRCGQQIIVGRFTTLEKCAKEKGGPEKDAMAKGAMGHAEAGYAGLVIIWAALEPRFLEYVPQKAIMLRWWPENFVLLNQGHFS